MTFRIKGAETEAARLARERSYAAYEKRLAEEKWISTKFHDKQVIRVYMLKYLFIRQIA